MNEALILLHEKALRLTHPVFQVAPKGTQALFIWDDSYFRLMDYSFKRLVFIFETLCELSVSVAYGETQSIIRELSPNKLYVPVTNHPPLLEIIKGLKKMVSVELVPEEPFVHLEQELDPRRFFQYWEIIKQRAFKMNGKSLLSKNELDFNS